MLVLLDLDDCIIDTSGSITPVKLKLSLEAMQRAGLKVDDFQKSYNMLLSIDSKSISSFHTLKLFLEKIDAHTDFFDIGYKIIQGPLPEGLEVKPRQGAIDLLEELKEFHILSLVTIGDESVQLEKLRKAGIDSSIFSIISVLRQDCKGDSYRSIVEGYKVRPTSVVACGDRVNTDLRPAKELGFSTIHIRWGRGKERQQHSPFVDFEVTELLEIKSIIKELELELWQ